MSIAWLPASSLALAVLEAGLGLLAARGSRRAASIGIGLMIAWMCVLFVAYDEIVALGAAARLAGGFGLGILLWHLGASIGLWRAKGTTSDRAGT